METRNRKKIVHIVKITGIYGVEQHLLILLPELAKIFNITLIILTEPGKPIPDYFKKLREKNIPYYNIKIYFNLDPICWLKLFFLLKKIRSDLVHTHLIHGDIYGVTAAK